MSTIRLRLFFLFIAIFGSGCFPALAQNCELSGAPAWNSALRNVIAGCSHSFMSPGRHFILLISGEGAMSVTVTSEQKTLQWSGAKLLPPAMLSWSPDSNAFFLNDGDGSGMSSSFRFFRIKGSEVQEDGLIEGTAVSFYRRRTQCSSSVADPNVWGFGWAAQGSAIFLLVQATADDSCGNPDDLIGLVVQTLNDKIVKSLSKAEMKERFGSLLPSSLFSE